MKREHHLLFLVQLMRAAIYMLKLIELLRRLDKSDDYEVDEKARSVQLTEAGNDKVEAAFQYRKFICD